MITNHLFEESEHKDIDTSDWVSQHTIDRMDPEEYSVFLAIGDPQRYDGVDDHTTTDEDSWTCSWVSTTSFDTTFSKQSQSVQNVA